MSQLEKDLKVLAEAQFDERIKPYLDALSSLLPQGKDAYKARYLLREFENEMKTVIIQGAASWVT